MKKHQIIAEENQDEIEGVVGLHAKKDEGRNKDSFLEELDRTGAQCPLDIPPQKKKYTSYNFLMEVKVFELYLEGNLELKAAKSVGNRLSDIFSLC